MSTTIDGNLTYIGEVSSAPATPSAGEIVLYVLSADKRIYLKDSTGAVVTLGATLAVNEAGASILALATSLDFKDMNVEDGGSSAAHIYANHASVPGGRLTLTTAVPVTNSDVTAAGTLYYTPFYHDGLDLFDGTRLKSYHFSELSLSLSGLNTSQPYDIFVYDNSGTLTLQAVAWTSNTVRSTTLVRQNGFLVKDTSNRQYRLLGTIMCSAANQCEDSLTKRFVSNLYNRELRPLKVVEATNTWTYASQVWRSLNTSTANRVEFVQTVNENPVYLMHMLYSATQFSYIGIALDATNTNDCDLKSLDLLGATGTPGASYYQQFVAIGYHFLQLTEYAAAATATVIGDNNDPTKVQMGAIGHIVA